MNDETILNDAAQPFTPVVAGPWDARLRIFRAGETVTTFALITDRFVVIIDTMDTPERAACILAAVAPEVASRQLLVINTHADWDHCWGNAVFAHRGCPIIGHARASARLQSATEQVVLAEKQHQDARYANVRLVAPTITFTDGLQIAGGDLTIALIPTPGHTPDHIAVWVPELRLLLAGDAAEHPFPYIDDPQALPVLFASLHHMAALHPMQVIPCHGGTTDPELIARNLAYFAAIAAHADAALAVADGAAPWRQQDDVPVFIGFPYAAALHAAQADPTTTPAFYRDFHDKAVRTVLAARDG